MIVASAPTRLDFGGGWTDVPPFPEERGGFVCNLAIERRATVTLHVNGSGGDGSVGGESPDPLVAAALRRAGITGARVSIRSEFPVGAGLGGSSAVGVALQAALAVLQRREYTPSQLAEWSRATEVDELGVAGGFQDHYAAAFGGALALTLDAQRHATGIPLTPVAIAALEARVTVIYTGESRISAETITAVLDAYRTRDARVVQALDRMAALARLMAESLHAGNVSELAELVDEHWVHQKSLHPRISTPRIDAIEDVVRKAGATGFKALGASGGGCVLAISPVSRAAAVRAAAGELGEVMSWRVATQGVACDAASAIVQA